MDDKLFEKIGRQEVIIEALKNQNAELSNLLLQFVSGQEKLEDWALTADNQLTRKPVSTTKPGKSAKPKAT